MQLFGEVGLHVCVEGRLVSAVCVGEVGLHVCVEGSFTFSSVCVVVCAVSVCVRVVCVEGSFSFSSVCVVCAVSVCRRLV